MNVKTTLTLLVLVLIVGGLFFFVVRDAPTTREIERARAENADVRGEAVFSDAAFAPDRVVGFEITRDGKTYVFTKDGEDWAMVEPAHFDAQLPTLPTEAATLRYTERFEPDDPDLQSLEELQLDPPRAEITFEFDEGERQTIRLGRRGVGGRGFAMVNDDPRIYYVENGLHQAIIERRVTEQLANRLDVPEVGQTDRVRLERRGDTIEMVKEDGAWRFDGDHRGRADQGAIDGLLGAARALWLSRFDIVGANELSLYGLDEPRAILTMRVPAIEVAADTGADISARRWVFRVGAPVDAKQESYFASWSEEDDVSPVVFRINASDLEKLNRGVDDLRDKRITMIDASEIRKVRIDRVGETDVQAIVIERTADGFAFGEPAVPYAIDPERAEALLMGIADAQAIRFVMDVSQAEDPIAVVELTALGQADVDRLRIYNAPRVVDAGNESASGEWMVIRNDETIGYVVDAGALEGVLAPPAALRDRVVLALDAGDLKSITLAQPDGTTMTLSRDRITPAAGSENGDSVNGIAGPWTLDGGGRIETDALDAVVSALTPLVAESWLMDGTTAASSDDMSLVVSIDTFDGDTHIVRVDPVTRHAVMDGLEDVFVIDAETLTALTGELRYRSLISTTSQRIARVEVDRDGSAIVITRDDSGRFVAESGGDVDQEAAGALFDVLSSLRAERFVNDGEAVRLGDNPVTFVIHLDDDSSHTLTVDPDRDLAELSDTPLLFTLGEATRATLLAPLAID